MLWDLYGYSSGSRREFKISFASLILDPWPLKQWMRRRECIIGALIGQIFNQGYAKVVTCFWQRWEDLTSAASFALLALGSPMRDHFALKTNSQSNWLTASQFHSYCTLVFFKRKGNWRIKKYESFKNASEASYLYILGGQKFIKKPKTVHFS